MNISKLFENLEKYTKSFEKTLTEKNKKRNNLQILIAIMLSARTKDKTTHQVCEKLFQKIKNIKDIEKISEKELEKIIYGVGFYKTKAKMLKKWPSFLCNKKLPKTIEQLIEIPGVGRKTANLFISTVYNIPAICVDTHVHRINNRLGLVNTKNAYDTEMELRKKLPQKYWIKTNEYFVKFGQNVCLPKKPKCDVCPISTFCKYYKYV